MALSINNFSCSFTVKTVHGSKLEFVLADARSRNKGTGPKKWFYFGRTAESELMDAEYYEILWDMLKNELSKTELATITDCCVYGDVSYTLQALSIDDLNNALIICKQIICKWINVYNVNKMKAN